MPAGLDAAPRARVCSVLDGFTPPDELGGSGREWLILRLRGLALLQQFSAPAVVYLLRGFQI